MVNDGRVLKGMAIAMVAALAVLSVPLLALGDNGSREACDAQQSCPSAAMDATSAVAFREDWREIWEDHVWYTREAIIGILTDSASTSETVNQLIQVAADTREAMRPYYGDQVDAFYTELVGHFTGAAEVVQTLKAGGDVNPAVERLYANAENMSALMNNMNPQFWKFDEVNAMWREHLDLTIQEAVQYFNGDFAGSAATFNMISDQGLEMADMFGDGIMNQFPDRFSDRACVLGL
ncbi:hypothetical protein AOA80_06610 [Methanomassiliicoccales archaeon RumEn M1]|nr:hypothetical protein AOA80_06610 [Methanomassiliicoccales archaeon RumEn M1]